MVHNGRFDDGVCSIERVDEANKRGTSRYFEVEDGPFTRILLDVQDP